MRFGKIAIISMAALVSVAAPAIAQDANVMQYADTNSDGKVTPQEYADFLGQAWNYFTQSADKVKVAGLDPMTKGLVSGVTPDADGMVSKAALLAAAPAKFKAADKNGDGAIDAAELNASMQGS